MVPVVGVVAGLDIGIAVGGSTNPEFPLHGDGAFKIGLIDMAVQVSQPTVVGLG